MNAHSMRRLRVTLVIVVVATIPITMTACQSATDRSVDADAREHDLIIPQIQPVVLEPGQRLRIVATTSIIGDVVQQVGDDAIALTVLVGPGQDPHSYEGTARDLAQIEGADIIFVNGLGLEEVLMDTIESIATGPVVPVSAGVEFIELSEELEDDQHGHGAFDPHVWMDPNNVVIWTQNIAQVLSEADPANAEAYAANADAYIAELEALDAYIREQVSRIPEENRKLVTDHLAFGYFAREYGFEMVGTVIPGATTAAEPSAGDMAELIQQLQTERITAIFVGMSASTRLQQLAELIAQEADTDIRVLALYIGSLDEPGQSGDTYIRMMGYNVDTMVEGLSYTGS